MKIYPVQNNAFLIRSWWRQSLAGFPLLVSTFTALAVSPDPSGLWKWSVPGRNGGPERVYNLKLKQEGDHLTGTLILPARDNSPGTEVEIKDAKLSGDNIFFSVSRQGPSGNTFVSKYAGKLGDQAIEGTIEVADRQPVSWKAERNSTGQIVAGAKIEVKPGYDEEGHKIANETKFKSIPIAEAESFLKEHPDAVILDVRTPKEFAAGHIPKAQNYNVADDKTYKEVLASLDKSKWYLVHSAHGGWRTVRVFEYFQENGFEHVVGLDGGFQGWSQAEKPVEK